MGPHVLDEVVKAAVVQRLAELWLEYDVRPVQDDREQR